MKTILALFLFTLYPGVSAMSEPTSDPDTATASFGGGCFWCIEPFFERLKGVETVESGYQGGTTENPTYKEVTSGDTGHAEVVRVIYNPDVIAYEDLLKVFFMIHDPTTLNRQGADVGTQYRSIILYYTDAQKEKAEETIQELEKKDVFSDPVVTQVEPAGNFYRAEGYHQDYFSKNPSAPYCRFVIAPKMQKVKIPKELLKDD